jgi:methylglutaconyl-CoA hydratase
VAEPLVLVDDHDAQIRVVTLNRPDKRNALSVVLIQSLRDAVAAAADDRARRVVVIRAAGPSFCAGLDLNEAAATDNPAIAAEALAGLYETICLSPLVTIAAAHGGAFGGGAGLLAACDLVLAADDLRLGFPEVRRGLVAALVTCLIRRQLGDRHVRELVLLGQAVAASRALDLGLVNRVVPAAQLLDAALNLAREVCSGAPGAVARTKRLLDDLGPRPIADELRRALAYHVEARVSPEASEGIAAFREKRDPRWGVRPGDSDVR